MAKNLCTSKLISLICISAAVACLCNQTSFAEPAPQAAKQAAGSLSCSISVQALEWRRPSQVEVSVVLENRSATPFDAPVVAEFHLTPIPLGTRPSWASEEEWNKERSYYADWDFIKNTAILFKPTLTIGPAEVYDTRSLLTKILNLDRPKNMAVDISRFVWAMGNSNVLPDTELYDAMPAGPYSLWLELDDANTNATLCSSNEVTIVIR